MVVDEQPGGLSAPRQRSGFVGWLLQSSVLGSGGLVLLALGVGSVALLAKAPSPPELAALQRHDGVVEAVLPRKVERLENGRYQTRRDGWVVRLEGGAEFFLGTPASFDDAGALSYARTEAALPIGSRVTLHADADQAWHLVSGSSTIIDYAEKRSRIENGTTTVTLLALVSLVLGALLCGSVLKRWWNSPRGGL